METRFKGVSYEIADVIQDRLQRKLDTLQKLCPGNASTTSAYVELGRETEAHQSGRVWKAAVNLTSNGAVFNAQALEETIENAIDKVVQELRKELTHNRKKEMTLTKRGGSILKALTRGLRG